MSEAMSHSLMKDKQVFGTLEVQVLDGTENAEDPWTKIYTAQRKKATIAQTYPLNNFRKVVYGAEPVHLQECHDGERNAEAGWSWKRSAEALTKYGFTAVKFDKKLVKADEEVQAGDFDDLKVLEETYFPEVKKSLIKLTGAKHVFITNSIVRTGGTSRESKQAQNQTLVPPTSNGGVNGSQSNDVSVDQRSSDTVTNWSSQKQSTYKYKASDDTRPTHLGSSDNLKPARGAHIDYSSLGARRSIRRWRPDIYAAAIEAGIIDAEDKICASIQINAQDKESNDIIDQKYNADGKLGPRYAAYSVWRPLRMATRDPLAMTPRWSFPEGGDLQLVPYELRVLASPAMSGDSLCELQAVSVTQEVAKAYRESSTVNNGVSTSYPMNISEGPQWYYIPEQQPDEVIVLKFFDSASLGGGVEAAGAPHASPDIGDAGYGGPRWSIEVRCIAIW